MLRGKSVRIMECSWISGCLGLEEIQTIVLTLDQFVIRAYDAARCGAFERLTVYQFALESFNFIDDLLLDGVLASVFT